MPFQRRLRFRTGRSILEMRTPVLPISFFKEDLTAMCKGRTKIVAQYEDGNYSTKKKYKTVLTVIQ